TRRSSDLSEDSSNLADVDLAGVICGSRQANFEALWRQNFREALAPFNEDHGIAIEDLVEAESGHLLKSIQTVQVDVIDAGVTIFVDQGEGGAGDFLRLGGGQGADNAFRQCGFSSA